MTLLELLHQGGKGQCLVKGPGVSEDRIKRITKIDGLL